MTTAADGTFLLSGFSPGVVPLRFRRLGYAIQFMDVDTRTPAATSLQITLKAVASQRVGDRPDRYEPRRRKRRPKPYDRLMKPRHEAKRRMEKGFREN